MRFFLILVFASNLAMAGPWKSLCRVVRRVVGLPLFLPTSPRVADKGTTFLYPIPTPGNTHDVSTGYAVSVPLRRLVKKDFELAKQLDNSKWVTLTVSNDDGITRPARIIEKPDWVSDNVLRAITRDKGVEYGVYKAANGKTYIIEGIADTVSYPQTGPFAVTEGGRLLHTHPGDHPIVSIPSDGDFLSRDDFGKQHQGELLFGSDLYNFKTTYWIANEAFNLEALSAH